MNNSLSPADQIEFSRSSEWFDRQATRLDRRLQLLRGRIIQLRGGKVGKRFGVGAGVQIGQPQYLFAGDDVSILNNVYMQCQSSTGVRIGDHTVLMNGVWIRCEMNKEHLGFFHVGEHSIIAAYTIINASGGGIAIGNHVLVGYLTTIHAGSHHFGDMNRLIIEQGTSHKGVVIEDDCWIGSQVTILDGVTIGRGSVVGAGSIVTKSIPAYSVAMGAPAKIVKNRSEPYSSPR